MYSIEQYDSIKTALKDYIYFFGYTSDPNSLVLDYLPTEFFDYGGSHIEEDSFLFNEYLERNKQSLSSRPSFTYEINSERMIY